MPAFGFDIPQGADHLGAEGGGIGNSLRVGAQTHHGGEHFLHHKRQISGSAGRGGHLLGIQDNEQFRLRGRNIFWHVDAHVITLPDVIPARTGFGDAEVLSFDGRSDGGGG